MRISSFYLILLLISAFSLKVSGQAIYSPVIHLSLETEPTQIPTDSLGATKFYSLSFEVKDTLHLVSAVFKLKSLTSDSVVNQQTFVLPKADGVYQTGLFPNGLIKDKSSFYILLGNVKYTEPLILITEFIDTKNTTYKDILTNE